MMEDPDQKEALLGSKGEPTIPYGSTTSLPPAIPNKNLHTRSATLSSFRFVQPPEPLGIRRSRSASADGKPMYLTPVQMGRKTLYTQVPFTAVFGLHAKEHNISEAFASYAADLNVKSHPEWNEQQKQSMSEETSHFILDELDEEAHKFTLPLAFAIVVATASQFLVGYNTGVMNAPEKVVFPGHSTALWSLAVAAFAIGGPFGAIAGGKLADSRGRRGALLICTWTFLMGGLLQSCASDMYSIILARFIVGFASGFSSVLVPIYLGELAPPQLRGTLGTLTQFALVVGIFAADLLAFPFTSERKWRILFGITPMVAMLQLQCSPFLLESPRWLLNHDAKSNRARVIIRQLRGYENKDDVEQEIANYMEGDLQQQQDEAISQYEILKTMISKKSIRTLLFSSMFLQVAQQFSGINAVFYYSTAFFEGVIDNPLVGTTVVGGVNVVAVYVAMLLMDSSGRKTLILVSSVGMCLSCVVIVMALNEYFNNVWALVAVNSYVTFFEIGLGPIPWLIVAEMFEGKYVATAMSLCCQINWACNFIVGLVFPYMDQTLGPFSFVPFAIVLAVTILFTLFVLPETQGAKPEELAAEMVRRNSESIVVPSDSEATDAPANDWASGLNELVVAERKKMREGTYDYGFKIIEGDP